MNTIKKTKIVATLGPATFSKEVIEKMILAGVNVFRINFSHANYNDVSERIQMIRKVDEKLNTNTAILADLQGPKLRVGKIEEGTKINQGDHVLFHFLSDLYFFIQVWVSINSPASRRFQSSGSFFLIPARARSAASHFSGLRLSKSAKPKS